MLKRDHKTHYIMFNIELVKAVEKHPCIYNVNLKEYGNREFVQEAWEKIAKEFDCSARECKDTWKNLRIVFSRNVKKQNLGITTKKKPYYLLDSMSYLLPFMKFDNVYPKSLGPSMTFEPSIDDETNNKEEEEDEKGDDNTMISKEKTGQTINIESAIKEECDSSDEYSYENFSNKQSSKENSKNDHSNEKNSLNDTNIDVNHVFKSKTNRENSKHQFLLSLFPDVDDMDDTQFRSFRYEVCKLITHIFSSEK